MKVELTVLAALISWYLVLKFVIFKDNNNDKFSDVSGLGYYNQQRVCKEANPAYPASSAFCESPGFILH